LVYIYSFFPPSQERGKGSLEPARQSSTQKKYRIIFPIKSEPTSQPINKIQPAKREKKKDGEERWLKSRGKKRGQKMYQIKTERLAVSSRLIISMSR
jgi:hypothetical protein